MDVDKYIAACSQMARRKAQDEMLRKVYADVNFQKLLDKAEAIRLNQLYMEAADYIFNNVSQNACAAWLHPGDLEE